MTSNPSAEIPDRSTRLKCRFIAAPHPSVIDPTELLQQCDLRTQRRSGPGGQHRNKTSSGAFLTHRSTGLVGEATERRSQAQNRDVVLLRLRAILAIGLRTPSPLDAAEYLDPPQERSIRNRYRKHAMKLNDANTDKPALLAMVLNDAWAAGGQPSLIADCWETSTSRIVTLLRSHAPALQWVNRIREHHGRLPLH